MENTSSVLAKVPAKDTPWILGAGGWNIFHHLGVLQAARELKVDVGCVTGTSAGAMTAAFISNGYSPEDLIPIFLEFLDARQNPMNLLRGFKVCDPLAYAVGGNWSLEPFVRELVEKYQLKPNNKLKIIACDILKHEPVVFQGTDYDLVTALTAACSVPGVFSPVWYYAEGRPMLLVDGAVYHYNPTEFQCGSSIVSKFRPASAMPKEWKWPADLYFHMRELFFPLAGNQRYVDETKHLVIETGLPEVAGLNFGISKETCMRMVENGYKTAKEVLSKAIAEGRFKGRRRCTCQ